MLDYIKKYLEAQEDTGEGDIVTDLKKLKSDVTKDQDLSFLPQDTDTTVFQEKEEVEFPNQSKMPDYSNMQKILEGYNQLKSPKESLDPKIALENPLDKLANLNIKSPEPQRMSVGEPTAIEQEQNEDAKSPYIQTNEDKVEQKIEGVKGAIAPTPPKKEQDTAAKLKDLISGYKEKYRKAQQQDATNKLIASVGKLLGTSARGEFQKAAGQDLGLKELKLDPAVNNLANERNLQKDLLDQYKQELSLMQRDQLTPQQMLQAQLSNERLLETREDRKRKAQQFKDSMSRRETEDFDKKVKDIKDNVKESGLLNRTRAMKAIESYLKDRYKTNLENPKSIDIEGMGVMGGYRPDFLTDEQDVSFRQNVKGLANELLKARSGAAVTDQEYRRFLEEVGSGNFSTEKNLMSGLKKMKENIIQQTLNITKTYGDEVFDTYIDRTGVDLYNSPDSKKVVKKQYSPSANKTKLTYSDGTEEIIDGKK